MSYIASNCKLTSLDINAYIEGDAISAFENNTLLTTVTIG
jgi:hypothetical protein